MRFSDIRTQSIGYFLVDVSKIRKRFDELSAPTLKSGRLYQLASFTQHGTTSTLDHVIAVAYSSLAFAMNAGIKVDERALVRGALMHDYYLYDWHDHDAAPDNWHGFTHPRHALNNAREDFPDLTPVEEDIILHHMFPLVPIPPHTKEAWIVTTCDKACSTAETLTGNPYKKDGFNPKGFSTPESDFQSTTDSKSDALNNYMDYGNLS